jgi:hypothetical protein
VSARQAAIGEHSWYICIVYVIKLSGQRSCLRTFRSSEARSKNSLTKCTHTAEVCQQTQNICSLKTKNKNKKIILKQRQEKKEEKERKK